MHHVVIPSTEILRLIKSGVVVHHFPKAEGCLSTEQNDKSAGFFLSLLRRIFDLARRFSLSTGLSKGSIVDLNAKIFIY
uniref:Uncharacterized protein n=1 Tax=Lepeophtheirus salmonis TaxID=72036 RepID=A0A0K2UEJ1_LEPSM